MMAFVAFDSGLSRFGCVRTTSDTAPPIAEPTAPGGGRASFAAQGPQERLDGLHQPVDVEALGIGQDHPAEVLGDADERVRGHLGVDVRAPAQGSPIRRSSSIRARTSSRSRSTRLRTAGGVPSGEAGSAAR